MKLGLHGSRDILQHIPKQSNKCPTFCGIIFKMGNQVTRGIKGEEILLLSRIFAVVDAFDAMTNDRIYRKAMDKNH